MLWLGTVLLAGLISLNLWILLSLNEAENQGSKQQAFWLLCEGVGSAAQRANLFANLVAEQHAEWRSAALQNLDLKGANLKARTLSKANFTGTNFSNSDLSNANLTGTKLDLCDCSSVNFQSAVMKEAQLFKARLDKADFRSAVLVAANLEQCSGDAVKFVRADLAGAYLTMAELPDVDFTAADLSGASLEAASLIRANLALANLSGANITDADLTGANWWRSRGLNSDQLSYLAESFPATKNDNVTRQRDFALWLDRFKQ